MITFDRLVKGRSTRSQAARGMPAVYIRQLQNLEKIRRHVAVEGHGDVIARHADMILRASEASVPEENDRLDVQAAYDRVVGTS